MAKPMNKNEYNHQLLEGQDHIKVHQEHKPYWKQVHHSWIFWAFLFLMFVGIIYYIMSVDFSFAPRKQLKQPSQNNRTP
jgi:hypothetical protein